MNFTAQKQALHLICLCCPSSITELVTLAWGEPVVGQLIYAPHDFIYHYFVHHHKASASNARGNKGLDYPALPYNAQPSDPVTSSYSGMSRSIHSTLNVVSSMWHSNYCTHNGEQMKQALQASSSLPCPPLFIKLCICTLRSL